jgi:type I restriction enzyme, S subunit
MKNGWETKKLDEACEVEYGTRVVNKRDGGTKYPVYGGGGATFFMDEYNREDRMVVARFAMSEQCTRFVNGKFFLNDSGLTVSPKNKNEIRQDFFNYLILSLNDEIYSLGRGTAQKNLDVPAFRNLSISYPLSIPEQQRIVSLLDEAFESIAGAKVNAERNLVNARELFEAGQRELFEHVENKKSEVKMLGDIASFRNGINFTKASRGETIKIVGVKDFQKNFWVPFDNLDSVTIDGKLNETDYLRKGDILAVRSNGNQQLIGRTILAGDVAEKTTHSGFTIRIRFESKDIFPEYLCHYLKSEKARQQLISGGAGISIKSLNQMTLTALPIPLPPLAEQRAIVARLDVLAAETKKLEGIYQSKLEGLEELKKSLLARAFEGEM